jgi:hypothetical protein
MNDYRMNWTLPALPLGPAIKTAVETRPCPIAAFERGSHGEMPTKEKPAAVEEVLPAGWSLCGRDANPVAAGWYQVGSPKTKYAPMHVRAWWDGMSWCWCVGLLDERYAAAVTTAQAIAGRMAWIGAPLDFTAHT